MDDGRCYGSEGNGLQYRRGYATTRTTLRTAILIATVALISCKPAAPSAAYLAVCEGGPLRTTAHRNQAMEDGYDINRQYDCVTKQSATAVATAKAQWAAKNTPEPIAARQAEADRSSAENNLRNAMRAQIEARAVAAREKRRAEDSAPGIVTTEVNTATAEQLAGLQWLGAEVAQQIVTERTKRRFDSWNDLVHRVEGLSTVETGMRASAFGLTVNGSSLKGAEPASSMARYMRRW